MGSFDSTLILTRFEENEFIVDSHWLVTTESNIYNVQCNHYKKSLCSVYRSVKSFHWIPKHCVALCNCYIVQRRQCKTTEKNCLCNYWQSKFYLYSSFWKEYFCQWGLYARILVIQTETLNCKNFSIKADWNA